MPLNRYQLRSEYSLADPQLYKVADKDDPEALLEGVAMAGLVGVLRQLGDLAEFAAEIFHDLHEEVMATAGRGHALIVRVQQLEAEFPSIERTLLSQTSHTAFLYNTGVDWHPNLHMDQSVVTRGDLPRFVMDSYEECRGPPRLFLLDKYDVAGAGACLKRFTDPSFFKTESTSTGRKLEGQREKKTRRLKKRGPRWRNGDTPESFPSSHAKLHQLFLEERIESGINDPARRVKLKKRQFTGSLFEQDNVRSYMEKFLDTGPAEQKILHEICIDPLQLTWTSDKACEAGLEIVEIGTISPVKESMQTDRTVCSPPDATFDPSMDDFNQDKPNLASDNESVEVPGFNNESTVSTIPKEVNVDAACEFDDVASEIDNYVDALANIESEVETDSESKKNPRYLNWKPIVADSDGSERQREFRSMSMDSQSIGNSATSEDGDIFSKGRESSSCSISVNTMTEATPELDAAVVAVPTAPASNSGSENMSFDQHSTSEEILRKEREKHAAASTVRAEVDGFLKSGQEFGEALRTSSLADSNKKVLPIDAEASLAENPSSDSVLEDSTKHDALLGETDQGHNVQTTTIASHTALSDSSEDSRHFFGVESIHDKEGQNTAVCPEMLHSLPNNSDSSVHLLKMESHNSASSSLVEGYDKDLERPDIDSCLHSGSPSLHQPVCEPTYLEKTNSIYLPCEENFSIRSIEESSKDFCSASDTSVSFGTQELLPVTMNPGCIPSLDFEAGNSPWSREDPSVENIIAVSERVPSALHVSQAGNPANSNQLQSRVPQFSSSEFTEAAEIGECGFLEAGVPAVVSSKDESLSELYEYADNKIVNDSFEVGKSSPTIDPLETQPEWLKLLSETIDSTVPAICQDEASKQHSVDDTCTVYPVPFSGDESKAVLDLSQGEPVSQDFTWIYLGQGKVLEPDTLVSEAATHHGEVYIGEANTYHDPAGQDGDENKNFYHDASSVDMPSKHAYDPDYVFIAENDSGSDHDVKKVEDAEIVTDSLGQVEVKDYPLENGTRSSSLSLHPEKQHEPTLLETEKFWQNDEELTKEHSEELAESRQLDLVQDGSVTSPAIMCNISPDDSSPSPLLLDDSLPEDLKNSGKLAAEAPLASEKSSEHLESTSSHEINPLEADNLDSLNHNILKPENDETETCRVVAALQNDGETTVSKTPPQSAEHTLETSHDNGMFGGANQGTQVENSSEPLCHSGFPDLGKNSAEPQINMEPPSLPPLPPMQWRLGKFQNAPVSAAERQMVQPIPVPVQVPSMSLPTMHHHLAPVQPMNLSAVHHALASFQPVNLAAGNAAVTPIPLAAQPSTLPTAHYAFAPLQPMTLPARDHGPETVARIFSGEGYSEGYFTQGGVVALPVPITASEGFYQINTSAVGRQDNLPPTVPSTSNNLDGYVTQQGIFVTPIPAVVSEGASQSDTSSVGKQKSQDNLPTVVTSSTTNSLIGTQLCEESNQPNADGPESRSFVEDNSSEHRSIMEAKVNVETGVHNELLGHDPQFPEEEEAANTYAHPLVSLAADQTLPGLMAPEAVGSWSSAYDMFPIQADGISNGTLQKKLPRPRNPLIDEVVAIDKSKLRKVDRTKTSLETKPNERESLIEQMQLRKVERVKPSVESKVEGGEYRLEHSQLRKVGERVKPSAEQRAEDDFSLEQLQLRKVGERVKPSVEPKSEERDFLPEQLQLRKVGVKTKQEIELKVEETGSPLAQLRKVKEKVREEVELKTEETESPRVQLRKVRERFREEVELKAEETESPRVQLRKVGERTQPQVGQKVEERDSLFEQIRNKSFHLKPAVSTRPNIQGPRTNLKVAAILEKASTIRQAMVGSDEDDDDADNWSDS